MTGAEIPIRPLGPFDLQALAELHAACFAEAWDAEALAALLAMPGAFALMAGEEGPSGEGEALGFVMVRAIAGEAEIISLGVRPERRRHGLGRRLLAAGSAEAALRGTQRLFLEVAADNLPARALYLGSGFAQIGRRENYYRRPGGETAALVLARDITVGRNPGSQIGEKS
jgi:[ribosomal protein S18]-alanine N-acetyltransferase